MRMEHSQRVARPLGAARTRIRNGNYAGALRALHRAVDLLIMTNDPHRAADARVALTYLERLYEFYASPESGSPRASLVVAVIIARCHLICGNLVEYKRWRDSITASPDRSQRKWAEFMHTMITDTGSEALLPPLPRRI